MKVCTKCKVEKDESCFSKQKDKKDNRSCLDYLEYSLQELEAHIEKQFLEPGNEWMNWDNQGVYNPITWDDNDPTTWTWNLDHIIPQSKFEFISMQDEQFGKCWALNNLRPYSSKLNVTEKDRR